MPTLGLGILAMNKEWAILERALESVHKHVDNIYLTIADLEEPSDEIKKIAHRYGAVLTHHKWKTCDFEKCPNRGKHPIINFAEARNFNMSQCKEDWYTWMDSDDTVDGMEKARGYLEKLPASIKYVLCTYNYAFYDNGVVSTVHPKERFIRVGSGHLWKGWLHECCVADYETDGARFGDIFWNHHSDFIKTLASTRRNIDIISHEIWEQKATGKVDPRTIFNLGMALSGVAQSTNNVDDWSIAIKAFYQYLEVSGWSEHAYMAWKMIGIGNLSIGSYTRAQDAFLEAIRLQPSYSDAYSMLGSSYIHMGDDERAEAWFKMALHVGEANHYASDLATKEVTPLISLATIYSRKGKMEMAKKYFLQAKKLVGKDAGIDDALAEIKKIQKLSNQASAEVARIKALPEDKQKEEYFKLSPVMQAHPVLVGWRRTMVWKTSTSGKEVTIFTGQSWEEWSPDNAKTGIGGSEEAVIYLSQELKKRGYEVTVYGSHGTEDKIYDGILYKPWWTWCKDEPTDVFIAWRDPNVFEYKINARKKYLWLHDVTPASALTTARLKNLDKVMVLSKYHRSLYPEVPDEKIMLSANGIIPEQFDLPDIKREPHRVIYASAPNRGLWLLLKFWGAIREKVPDAELFWAYGWNTFDKAHQNNPQMMQWKGEVMEMLKQPGVHDLGRIGHEDLARLMASSKVWAYPTTFTEIFPLHGDTLIETSRGQVPIKKLSGKDDIFVYSWNEKKRIIELSKVNWCGMTRKNTPVIELKMKYGIGRNGKKTCNLILTPDHPVMMRDGSWKQAKDIVIGDRVMPMNRVKNGWGNGYDLMVAGYEYSEAEHRIAVKYHTKNIEGLDVDHIDGDTTNNDPSNLQALSTSDHWKKTWAVLPKKEFDRRAKRSEDNIRKWESKMTKEELSQKKRDAVNTRWAKQKALGNNHIITDIKDAGSADVYCMEVEPNHNFVANSVVVHNCITAVKMQAAGVIPVCTNVAALDETVQFGDKFICENIDGNPDVQKQFVEAVIKRLMEEQDTTEMVKWARENWTWGKVADQWDNEFSK